MDPAPRLVTAKPTQQFNRYDDILPVASTIVRIYDHPPSSPAEGKLLYINANHMVLDGCEYIAAQGPLGKTAGHFWRMVWQKQVAVIVMLGVCRENNVDKVHKYWPDLGATREFPAAGLGVDNVGVENHRSDDWIERTCELYPLQPGSESPRKVLHLQFTAWKDHAIPRAKKLAAFLRAVEKATPPPLDRTENQPPILVHCSAGVGRSGVVIALRTLLRRLDVAASPHGGIDALSLDDDEDRAVVAEKTDAFLLARLFDVRTVLYSMRRQRSKMIQTSEQYAFCHSFLLRASVPFVGFDFSTFDS